MSGGGSGPWPGCRTPRSLVWRRRGRRASPGGAGDRTCPSASGGPSARTTAPTATPGTTSRTTTPAPAPTAGARTGSPGSRDDRQRLCFALALWNGKDPILKERLFGLTNAEGNHGEDVKELYYYLDATPTHSYMQLLYKLPAGARTRTTQLVRREPAPRAGREPEYELVDTGVFDDGRYFDVVVEYAKADPEDLLVRITATNRGPEAAPLHLLPHALVPQHLDLGRARPARPRIRAVAAARPGRPPRRAVHAGHCGTRRSSREGRRRRCLFTENETNTERLFGAPNAAPVREGRLPRLRRRRAAGGGEPGSGRARRPPRHYAARRIPAGRDSSRCGCGSRRARRAPASRSADFDASFADRAPEADDFYAGDHPARSRRRRAARPAAGLRRAALDASSSTSYDVAALAQGDPAPAAPPARGRAAAATPSGATSTTATSSPCRTSGSTPGTRRGTWPSTPSPLAPVDPEFAKEQLAPAAARVVHAPERPAPGLRVDLRRREPAGPRLGRWRVYKIERRLTRPGATARSSSGSSTSCCSTSPGG